MPLTVHIEEMVLRLAAVLAVAGLVTAIAFPFAQEPITYIWYSLLPETVERAGETISTQPRVYGPLELKLMELKLASLAGLIAALPMGVYQTYRFMRPGLYPHERRYYLAAVPTSLVLAFIGIAFAFFVVLPAIFTYFLYYSENAAEIAFALQQTFNLIIILKAFMAMVFQIPLLIMLAIMMGVTTRRWLENRRLYFWAGFMGIAFIFSPDPTGMAPLLVAATMVVLFEGTLALLRWTGN
ncbi:preprotein translocase subunit TatA [Halobacteriales archaeon QS_1_68_20]|nr:MAG: preprotein translocase subunit TatA [Halobacteriales archaeon QS_1_68_20]